MDRFAAALKRPSRGLTQDDSINILFGSGRLGGVGTMPFGTFEQRSHAAVDAII
jgi:hypothetical protein